jgi:hypothetical protein
MIKITLDSGAVLSVPASFIQELILLMKEAGQTHVHAVITIE